jgi:hypothetical protein
MVPSAPTAKKSEAELPQTSTSWFEVPLVMGLQLPPVALTAGTGMNRVNGKKRARIARNKTRVTAFLVQLLMASPSYLNVLSTLLSTPGFNISNEIAIEGIISRWSRKSKLGGSFFPCHKLIPTKTCKC